MANFDRTSSPPFLRRLLIEPEYRMARHLILILILVVTALNQAFMTMRVGLDVMGHTIFIQVLFLFITYLITCYFNLWVLLPRHLLKKRYIQYMVYLVITIFYWSPSKPQRSVWCFLTSIYWMIFTRCQE